MSSCPAIEPNAPKTRYSGLRARRRRSRVSARPSAGARGGTHQSTEKKGCSGTQRQCETYAEREESETHRLEDARGKHDLILGRLCATGEPEVSFPRPAPRIAQAESIRRTEVGVHLARNHVPGSMVLGAADLDPLAALVGDDGAQRVAEVVALGDGHVRRVVALERRRVGRVGRGRVADLLGRGKKEEEEGGGVSARSEKEKGSTTAKRAATHLDTDLVDLLARLVARLVVEPGPAGQAVLERLDDGVDDLLGVVLAVAPERLLDKVAPDREAERRDDLVEARVVARRRDVGGKALEAV